MLLGCGLSLGMNIWTRLVLLLVILAIFCYIASEVFRIHPELYPHKKVIAGSLAGAGTLLWLIGKVHGSSAESGDTTRKGDGVFTLRFSGSLLAACGAVVSNIVIVSQLIASPQSMLRVAAAQHLPNLNFIRKGSTADRPRDGAKGPLKVQGIFYRERDPSAIINGQTVSVGDRIGTARVVAIERQSVTVEIAQERKVLSL